MNKWSIITIAILILLILSSNSIAQIGYFKLKNREYTIQNGKWYTTSNGKIGDEIIPQRLVVRAHDRRSMENFNFKDLGLEGVSLASKSYLNGYYVLSLPSESEAFSIASTLGESKIFDVVEFDAYGKRGATPNDPQYSNQWNLSLIGMPNGWDISTGSSSEILAIIDSGILYTHEDLDANIWVNPDEDRNDNGIPDFYSSAQGGDLDGVDDDSNGLVDDLIGWDYYGDGSYPYQGDNDPDDTDGHGTLCAGIAVAQTNNYEQGSYVGISGIAGGWGAQKGSSLMVLRDGDVTPIHSLTALAIEYAADNGAGVISRIRPVKYIFHSI